MNPEQEIGEILEDTIFRGMQIMDDQVCGECRIDRVENKRGAIEALSQLIERERKAGAKLMLDELDREFVRCQKKTGDFTIMENEPTRTIWLDGADWMVEHADGYLRKISGEENSG